MKPEAKKFLVDILQSVQMIDDYHSKLSSFNQFKNNQLVLDAISRRFGIIGEALNKAIKIDNAVSSSITDYKKIIRLRNILIHDYDLVDAPILWKIMEKDIPVLRVEIERILKIS